jgi:hypothetical protein
VKCNTVLDWEFTTTSGLSSACGIVAYDESRALGVPEAFQRAFD